MTVAFDTTTYPLETGTGFKYDMGNRLDVLSGGGVRSRTVTTLKPVALSCDFMPQSEAESLAFIEYVDTLIGVEIDLPHNTRMYRGFIDGESMDKKVGDGVLHYWNFKFMGRVL
jgi:hypothetical protein